MRAPFHDVADYGPSAGAVALTRRARNWGLAPWFGVSLGLHVFVALTTWLLVLILSFFGILIPLFQPLAIKPRDLEFVIVESPEAPPRNKNTRVRSDRASRSGGQKVANRRPAEPVKKSGTPKPSQRPQAPAQRQARASQSAPRQSRPVPRPTPQPARSVTAAATPTPRPSPAPPAPKLPTPVPKQATAAPSLPPNPLAGIKVPAAPAPKTIAMGPVASTSMGTGSGSGGGGVPGPSQVPGSVSGGGGGSSAGSGRPGGSGGYSGSGGRGSYNQAGSPGGGGGRPGIDALPEPDWGAYMADLQRRIKRNWHPPQAQEDKRVVVLFRIGRDGRLVSTNINRSSGFVEADRAAIEAVKLSAPFRPLPAAHRGDDIAIEFTFDYNVMKASGIRRG